jgi:hypothetical protein
MTATRPATTARTSDTTRADHSEHETERTRDDAGSERKRMSDLSL